MATNQSITSYSAFLKALLSDRERFFEEVVEGVGLGSKLRYAVFTIIGLAGFFGLVAGAYSGPAQAASAGIKLPFLFLATFAVCFPAFFVVQVLACSSRDGALRPFRGAPTRPVRVAGGSQGPSRAPIDNAVNPLPPGHETPPAPHGGRDTIPESRALILPPIDTVADSTHRRRHP